jgi:hemolysin activation/secretion protein
MPQDLPRTPPPPATFRLNGLRLNGAQALPEAELKAVTQPYIGRDVALADLEALAKSITELYRARGFFLATAVVPVQTERVRARLKKGGAHHTVFLGFKRNQSL